MLEDNSITSNSRSGGGKSNPSKSKSNPLNEEQVVAAPHLDSSKNTSSKRKYPFQKDCMIKEPDTLTQEDEELELAVPVKRYIYF